MEEVTGSNPVSPTNLHEPMRLTPNHLKDVSLIPHPSSGNIGRAALRRINEQLESPDNRPVEGLDNVVDFFGPMYQKRNHETRIINIRLLDQEETES